MSLVNRCVLMLMLAIVASAPTLAGEPEKKITELEAQLAALPKKKFDFNLHNQLRDLYGSVDKKKSMLHAEAILEHQILDDYLRNILSDWHKDNALAIERLSKHATEHNRQQLDRQVNQIIFTLAESSRYHGYKDKAAPAFLNYEIFKFVDLRDRNRRMGNSKNVPLKDPEATEGFNMKYRDFFRNVLQIAMRLRIRETTDAICG